MDLLNIKQIIGLRLIAIFSLVGLLLGSVPAARASSDLEPPALPSGCASLAVPAGNETLFHVYAIGVQVYRWNGATWDFVAPVANLYADAGFNGKVGFHYVGPTWESNSGSKVVAARRDGCTPDANAIPWLKLQAVSNDGPGIFSNVTFIQRVNTTGGLIPSAPGSTVGEEKRVPYTAEYYFYRAAE
jgi:hypothetical protein